MADSAVDRGNFAPGDVVEYTCNYLGFKPNAGSVGVVERVDEKWLYVTWISLVPGASAWEFVRNGAREHWMRENFRKLGEVERG